MSDSTEAVRAIRAMKRLAVRAFAAELADAYEKHAADARGRIPPGAHLEDAPLAFAETETWLAAARIARAQATEAFA